MGKTELKLQDLMRKLMDFTKEKFTGKIILNFNDGGITRIEKHEELKMDKIRS